MQLPIYQSEEEQRLMVELWSPALADDPEAFVLFAFPWGQKNTPLHKFKGPRKWQREVLRDIKAHIDRQQRQGPDGHPAGGGVIWPGYWQVGVGELAGAVDADHPHRRSVIISANSESPAALGDMGRADQVGGDDHQQPLV
jgi:hypothetical protein